MKDKRITRLVKLLQMLQGGRGQNSDGLAKACGVGRRTIFRDLETLRQAGVPLEFDAAARRYSIPHGAFGPPSDLTAEEVLSLWALANSAGEHSRLPFYEAACKAVSKLERSLSAAELRKFRRTAKRILFLPLKPGISAAKSAVYQLLLEALEKRQIARLEYGSLTEWERITTDLRPYQLFFLQHSWYVVGHSSLHAEVRNFNLSRIQSLKLLKKRYSFPKSFDLKRRIGNAWIMIPETGRDSHVVVKFDSLVAQNVAEVAWHKTQRTRFLPDGSLIYQATVSGINEIAWWILGYGDQAEVLLPAKLRRLSGAASAKYGGQV